ncbi:metallophosphoesterase [Motiliproteus coralliicola]|uniref:Metallophosphoesterase n=1 Tax=Motiliproteus coralliicola TaxID=2283196 RepID=A0A369WV03_9GAMM|nr:metallophosphoesterase family protein [Motiliproteus coralliicola]RDE24899.1 metallophosphoesterase [Motiliproteus coralliicola]
MKTLDLGSLSGPLLIFGGPYGNLQATQALRRESERLGLSPAQVICNGDLVAYCAEPQPTVDFLRDWGVTLMQGNCEQSLAEGAIDCGCGFEQGSTCSLLSQQWYRFCMEHTDASTRAWMGTLAGQLRFELAGRKCLVIHGGLSRNNRFLFSDTDEQAFTEELKLTDAELIVGGHCGIPFGRTVAGRHWLNSGVIGMPANDGSRDGWYLLLQPLEGAGLKASWHRLAYDAELAAQRMRLQGLDNGYAQALISGVWPSNDVLPQALKVLQGQRLTLSSLHF